MTGDGLPVQDLDYRYGVYRPAHLECELLRYFPNDDHKTKVVQIRGVRTLINRAAYGEEIHHIHSQGRQRFDRVWNLINASKLVHRWCEVYKNPARVLALYHKIRVGEHDESAAHACLGHYPIGWTFGHKPDAGDPAVSWVVPFWEAITKQKGVA